LVLTTQKKKKKYRLSDVTHIIRNGLEKKTLPQQTWQTWQTKIPKTNFNLS
jgi:hypothetical protein